MGVFLSFNNAHILTRPSPARCLALRSPQRTRLVPTPHLRDIPPPCPARPQPPAPFRGAHPARRASPPPSTLQAHLAGLPQPPPHSQPYSHHLNHLRSHPVSYLHRSTATCPPPPVPHMPHKPPVALPSLQLNNQHPALLELVSATTAPSHLRRLRGAKGCLLLCLCHLRLPLQIDEPSVQLHKRFQGRRFGGTVTAVPAPTAVL